MLVPMRAILAAADKYRYGQGAFNMNSVGQIEAAVRIHELLHSGAILQGAEASNAFMGGEVDEFRVTLGYTFFSRTQCSFEFSDRFKNRENGEKSIFIISAG